MNPTRRRFNTMLATLAALPAVPVLNHGYLSPELLAAVDCYERTRVRTAKAVYDWDSLDWPDPGQSEEECDRLNRLMRVAEREMNDVTLDLIHLIQQLRPGREACAVVVGRKLFGIYATDNRYPYLGTDEDEISDSLFVVELDAIEGL